MGAVKGAGLGVVQGGIDARGGTGASTVADQTDTGKQTLPSTQHVQSVVAMHQQQASSYWCE